MTISTTTSRWEAVGDGSTTVFPYNNKIFADTDLKVYLNGVLQTLTTHYTVSGAGNASGGNVTFLTAPATNVSVVIVREVANTQLIAYPAAGAFPSVATEDGLDRRTIISQQNVSKFGRAIQYLESDANLPSPILPTLDSLKGKVLTFNPVTGAPEGGVYLSGTASVSVQYHSGDGVTIGFVLSPASSAETSASVYVGGHYQYPSTYTLSGSSLIFPEPPPTGTNNIVVVLSQEVPVGIVDASAATYLSVSGSTSRSVQSRLQDVVSIKDFGAVGDGVADDTAAVQRALESGLPIRETAARVYRCSSAITVTNTDVICHGVHLTFTGATDGVVVNQNGDQKAFFVGCHFLTTQQEPGTGLTIDRSSTPGALDRLELYTRVEHCRISGTDEFSTGWTYGLKMDECTAANVFRNEVIGRRDTGVATTLEAHWWPGMVAGIFATSSQDKSPVDCYYDANYITYAQTAFLVTGVQEGDRFSRNTVVACRDGIDIDRTEILGSPTNDPYTLVTENHLNVSRDAIKTNRSFFSFFCDNLLYEFIHVDLGFTGIVTTIGNWNQCYNNIIRFNDSATNAAVGISLQSSYSRISQNTFASCNSLTQPILVTDVTSGTVGQTISNNKGYDVSGVEVQTVYYAGTATEDESPNANYFGVIASGSNTGTGPHVATAGAPVAVGQIILDGYPVGSKFLIRFHARALKGGTAGLTRAYVSKSSGTGTVVFGYDATLLDSQNPSQPAATTWATEVTGIVKKTVAGTINVGLWVSTAGSSATVAAGDAQWTVERIA